MTTMLDDVLKSVVSSLKEKNMWNDTLFIFSSDVGHPAVLCFLWDDCPGRLSSPFLSIMLIPIHTAERGAFGDGCGQQLKLSSPGRWVGVRRDC